MIPRLVIVLFAFIALNGEAEAYCFDQAGAEFGVNPRVLKAIAKAESGLNPAAINRNRNGSFDYGLMQINSWWYTALGPAAWEALADPCYNVRVGAWILADCQRRYGANWRAVGCYNASSENRRREYANKVHRILKKDW